jgi:hypothetical protein
MTPSLSAALLDLGTEAVYCSNSVSHHGENMRLRQLIGLALATSLVAASSTAGSAETLQATATAQDTLDGLSAQILRKEIELMQMTTRFRLNNKRESQLHKWFVAVISTCGYSIVDAGNIVTLTNGFRYHTHPQNLSVGRAESGPFLIFLGEIFFLGRTTGAVTIDLLERTQRKNRGFDRKTYEAHASKLRSDVQALLKQRADLAGTGAAQSEQLLLTNLAAAADAEYVANYSRAARIDAYRLWDDLLENYTSGTGAFAGALPTYMAAVESRPRMTGPGGIGFILSGGGFIADHALARVISLQAEKRSRKRLGGKPPDPETLQANVRKGIERLSALQPENALLSARRKGYALLLSCLEQQQVMEKRERQRENRKFWHDQLFDSVEGGANIGAGTIIANAGFRYNPHGNPLAELSGARHFLTRFAWGATTFTPTASAGIIDTPAGALADSFMNKYDAKRQISPDVVLDKRLNLLEQAARLLPSS